MSIVHIAFYPSDWLAGTRALSDTETGVYITLIAHMYEMAGPIERDDERLSRMCGCRTRASFLKSLSHLISVGKIIDENGVLFNERAEKEIKITTEKSGKAKAAAQSRWDRKPNKNNDGSDANAYPKHMPQTCQSESESYKEDLGKPKSCPFSDFWAVWPVKISKASAEKAWAKLSQADRLRAIEIAPEWFERWRQSNPQATPIHPASFLNQKRWTDEIPQRQFTAITGGQNDKPASKSQQRMDAFIRGAQISS